MEKKTLLLVGGGALLLVVLYLATRSRGAGASGYVVNASSPADPNVLAAQVQQDQIKGQIALATINAAGSLDLINAKKSADIATINAQSTANVAGINAAYTGQGYLETIAANLQRSLAGLYYNNIATQTPVSSQSVPLSGTGSAINTRAGQIFLASQSGAIPRTDTTNTTVQPSQQTYQQKAKDCWWRRNVPIIGAVVC
jgi:hypothetical protein